MFATGSLRGHTRREWLSLVARVTLAVLGAAALIALCAAGLGLFVLLYFGGKL